MPAEADRPVPVFVGSEIYRGSSYGRWHPLRIPRVSTVMDLARALDWLPPEAYRTSPRANAKALAIWHDPSYVAALKAAEAAQEVSEAVRARHALGTASNPVFPEMFRRPATGAGGTMMAAASLAAGPGIWHVPGGGTHHGLPDRANGFCYLNDVVLGLLTLRAGGLRRLAYIDIDAHHPDGVAHAFAGDPDVLTISIHEENRWPRTGALEETGAGGVFNLPLPRGAGDDAMALALDRLILPALKMFGAEAIVLQCGADAVAEDPQSHLAMSNRAHLEVVSAVMAQTDRLLVLGGGGYNPWSVGRLWTAVWGVLSGRTMPDLLPQPARDVLQAIEFPGHRLGKTPPAHWRDTLIDVPRPGAGQAVTRERLDLLAARLVAWV